MATDKSTLYMIRCRLDGIDTEPVEQWLEERMWTNVPGIGWAKKGKRGLTADEAVRHEVANIVSVDYERR